MNKTDNTPNPFSLSSTSGKSDSTVGKPNTLDKEIDELLEDFGHLAVNGAEIHGSIIEARKKLNSLIADEKAKSYKKGLEDAKV